MKAVIIQLIVVLFLGCSQEIDFKRINALMDNEQFEETIRYIKSINTQTITDSLDLKRLNHKLLLATKAVEFYKIKYSLNNDDTSGFIILMDSLYQVILGMDSLKGRWYKFDYHFLEAKYYLKKQDKNNWFKAIVKSLDFPTERQDNKISATMDIAFYYAEKRQYEEAREWMDKAVRSLDISQNKQYGKIYTEYMNGNFKNAAELTKTNIQNQETKHWQQFHSFLKLYADSLTMENRFRLW
ncbi:MAG: hypothetical protein H6627_00330 [Calditrichae bacterium]|nr:hypothetical protein [Calditrichia bacterium]